MFQFIRIKQVMPHIRGRLLDIGCGNNRLVNKYNNGVGINSYSELPNSEFDTVTFIASLNYLSEIDTDSYLDWIRDSLSDDGSIIVTCRRIWKGLSKEYIAVLFSLYGFHLTFYRRFFPFNALYIFKRQI